MVNFMRNMGSSIGTSIVTTMIARRAQYHQEVLVGHVTPDTPAFRKTLNALTHAIAHSGLSLHDARLHAIARFYALVNRQAHTLAYLDTFWVLAVLSAVMFILAFFLKKNDPGAAGQVAAG
jgi:DHA2 family multidrug resistance protein